GDDPTTGTVNAVVSSVTGAAVSLDSTANNAAAPSHRPNERVLHDDSERIAKITIATTSGIANGASEKLVFGTTALAADGTGVTAQSAIAVGGVSVDVTYAGGVFTVSKAGGGVLTKAQTEAVIAGI